MPSTKSVVTWLLVAAVIYAAVMGYLAPVINLLGVS